MPLVIDGYNLLRAIQDHFERSDIGDAELCMVLREYLRRTRQRAAIVFDGIGPRNKERLQGSGGLQIIFSGQGIEADDVIERMILENSAPKRLIVVSTDRRIATAAKHRKCQTARVLDFWQQLCGTMEKPQAVREPGEKRSGISPAETELWLREFGLGKKRNSSSPD
jgi:predicted RNA-binding protein with PIN domain